MGFIEALKKGNTSSGVAALGNTALAGGKGLAAVFSGSGTMFASSMHSLADAVNQGFVYFGSVLAERPASEKFPTGFGRVINIFCMVAVIVVTIMAYETIKEGWHLLVEPKESEGFWVNMIVLIAAFVVDGAILLKAMKEIAKETSADKSEGVIKSAFTNVKNAAPATRLVFYEDLVATSSAVLAIIGILLAQFFGVLRADGVASIIIGLLMLFVAFRVGYDNMIGLIGVSAPAEVKDKITKLLLEREEVVDIEHIRMIQEGRLYHVEGSIELKKGITLTEADDIKYKMKELLLRQPEVADVILATIEDEGVLDKQEK
ncbi:cation diffusion facilitator family transporter [Oceanobacillus senegalensis]|uniref:cation diffusion facilitator family transporter n=1 Tax=Oceanobacillus senegalensis TaxID=1936063 RepID=UPI00117DD00F|nr:cation diffusion facilitator family transporter [Oceanobacillus senegalensis]